MITLEEYMRVFEYLVKHNHTIRVWYDQYTSIPDYFTANNRTVTTDDLIVRLIRGDSADLQAPASFPQHLHTDALEALKNLEVHSLLLHTKLGVDI